MTDTYMQSPEADNGPEISADKQYSAEKKSVVGTRGQKIVVIAILAAINMSYYMDKMVMAILVEPIKQEFAATDTQMGLLTGFGFSLVYGLLVVPLGRLSDNLGRKRVVTGAILLWSVMTTLCGLATNFVGLVIARMGVGAGEAAMPAVHSLTSDLFPPARRPLAISLVGVGGPVGAVLGFVSAGAISEYLGWRWAFIVAGLPGLALALIVALYIREPARSRADRDAAGPAGAQPGFGAAMRVLWNRRSYVLIIAGVTFAAAGLIGLAAWTPAFFMRVHHLSSSQLGMFMGLQSVGGIFGTVLGGWLCSRFYRPDGKMLVWVMAGGIALGAGSMSCVFLVESTAHALMLLPLSAVASSMWLGPFYTVQQELAGARLRSTASSIGFLCFNLIGLGAGPLMVGLCSDALSGLGAETALRYGLLCTLALCLPALALLALSLRSIARDMAEAQSGAVEPGSVP